MACGSHLCAKMLELEDHPARTRGYVGLPWTLRSSLLSPSATWILVTIPDQGTQRTHNGLRIGTRTFA